MDLNLNRFEALRMLRESTATGEELRQEARDYISICEAHEPMWRLPVVLYPLSPDETGAILLAGKGEEIATAFESVLLANDGRKLLLRDLPADDAAREGGNEWEATAWLRVLRRDWRAMSTMPEFPLWQWFWIGWFLSAAETIATNPGSDAAAAARLELEARLDKASRSWGGSKILRAAIEDELLTPR